MPNNCSKGRAWAIVLAAGHGTRLQSLTQDHTGTPVPKQFCSLRGGASLFEITLARAAAIVPRAHVTAVVDPSHRQHWMSSSDELQTENRVIQPLNRGTAIGILLPTLSILKRDPDACIVVLPSDHYVADEHILQHAIHATLQHIRDCSADAVLLGIEADGPDPELGYIIAEQAGATNLRGVHRFVEKPPLSEAEALLSAGALWNSFILVYRGRRFIELYRERCGDIVDALRAIEPHDYAALQRLYDRLPSIDFSRDIAIGQERRLAVMRVPRCGWNDLGTPHRLALTLMQRARSDLPAGQRDRWINLADRLAESTSN